MMEVKLFKVKNREKYKSKKCMRYNEWVYTRLFRGRLSLTKHHPARARNGFQKQKYTLTYIFYLSLWDKLTVSDSVLLKKIGHIYVDNASLFYHQIVTVSDLATSRSTCEHEKSLIVL